MLASCSTKAIAAFAHPYVECIEACAIVVARRGGALVDISRTVRPLPARVAPFAMIALKVFSARANVVPLGAMIACATVEAWHGEARI